jgi:dynein heavy chain 2, cytosolic
LANAAAAVLGHPELAQGIAAAPEVTAFLNDSSVKALQVLTDGKRLRLLVSALAEPPAAAKEVHFLKIDDRDIDPRTVQSQVLISSIRHNAISSLSALISRIYVPLLRQGDTEADAGKGAGHALRDPLYSLRAGLLRTIRKGGTNLKKVDFNPDEQFGGILEPLDEIQVWQDLEREQLASQENEKLRKNAEAISRHLAPVQPGFQELHAASLGTIMGFIDTIEVCLGNVWTDPAIVPAYPEKRMENTFRVISKAFGGRIEREFKESDVWQASFSDVRLKLNECLRICSKWKDCMGHLTKIAWKQKMEHQWKGAGYVDHYLENVIIRMNEIFELRSQHDELLRLLSADEQKEMKVEGFFDPFRKINSFYMNEVLVATWQNARKQYERALEPVEKEICQKLRKEVFQEPASTPTQLMREFQRWRGLMSKETIRKALAPEREDLVARMLAEVEKMAEDFSVRTGQSMESIPGMEKPPQCQNVSPVISAIIWARQLSQKIDSNLQAAKSLFMDLPSLQRLVAAATDLRASISAYERGRFEDWQRNILAVLQDPNQQKKYQMTGQLMDFDFEAGGLLKVSYSEKLVTLVKDARAIGEHGFPLDKSIQQIVDQAKKFYKEGVALKQIANFYNSMGTQMIDCQKPMMLQQAQRFEQTIKKPMASGGAAAGSAQKFVTWDDPHKIEQYTKEVQKMATELINENRKLRRVHINVTNEVIELMNIDLLKSPQDWENKMNQIKRMVDQETKARPADLCRLWLTHINYQLYKALEFQYRMGLESLNENLPEISADLVFRGQRMEFRPPFEALKQKYFNEIQKFITTPLRFRGVGGGGKATEIFLRMPENNAKHMHSVYLKAEELFEQVRNVQSEFAEWTALSHLDIEAHIEEHFKGVEDWEANFAMLKQKRIELKKLPDTKKIDCITINIVPFKGGIEEVFKKLAEALFETL